MLGLLSEIRPLFTPHMPSQDELGEPVSTHSLCSCSEYRPSPLQLFTSYSPLPLSDPSSVFTPLVGTCRQAPEVHPIHHALVASQP
jgi:hypothetical protein